MINRIYIPDYEYKQRVERAAKLIREKNIDVMVVMSTESDYANARYFSGFWPLFERAGVAISASGDAALLVGPESEIFGKDFGKLDKVYVLKEFREAADPSYPELRADTFSDVFKRIGVSGENIRIGLGSYVECTLPVLEGLKENFPKAEIVNCNEIMVELRKIKSENELACIKEGFRIIEIATDEVIRNLKPGVTELQMVGIAQKVIYEEGAEYEGLPMYVFSEKSTSHAISRPRYRTINKGDIVQLNLSAKVDGYSPSIGLPVVMGKAEGEKRRIIEFCKQAHDWTEKQIKAGVMASHIAKGFYNLYLENGMKDNFVYGPCHGTGMIEVEAPWMETTSDYELMENMTFQIDTFVSGSTFVGQKLMSVPDKAAPLLQIGCYDRGFVYTETLTSLAIKGHDDGTLGGGMPTGMDYCAEKPEYVMRAGRELKNETGGYVILSTDYGRYGVYLRDEWGWKIPIGGALSADVKQSGYPALFVVTPDSANKGDGAIWKSLDWGKTWEEYTGIDVAYDVSDHYIAYTYNLFISDKADGNTFYFLNGSNLWVTRDCGVSWENTYTFDETLRRPGLHAVPGKAGNIWLESNDKIWYTLDYGCSWETLDTIQECTAMSFGKGRNGLDIPACYIDGKVNGVKGLFISDDMGKTWKRMDNDAVNYEVAVREQLAGDMNTYGRVFASTGGHGIVYYEYTGTEEELENVIHITGDETGVVYSECMYGETLVFDVGTANEKDYIIIVAERDSEGNLIKTELLNGETYTVGNSAVLEIFLWNNTRDMIPLREKTTLNIAQSI